MKVLLVVIDGATPRVVCPAVQTGQLPSLWRIADAGGMHQRSASIFPSITPAATSSIITGAYPAEHGIAGASWYDPGRDEVAYYGDDFWTITREGYGSFLRDFLVQLNATRLKAPTLFERVEGAGRRAVCINYLIFRGNTVHTVKVPLLIALMGLMPLRLKLSGPSMLCLGDFVTPRAGRRKVKDRSGPLHRFGMDDASTAAMLGQLVAENALGDFAVAYFADNDFRSHAVGPHDALPVVERVDNALGAMFDAAGGFERFMRDTCVIVTSDHGHCEVPDEPARAIRLERVLGDLQAADLAKGWRKGDQILICPNMRAAQIYIRPPVAGVLERVVRAAVDDPRIDLVMWHPRVTGGEPDAYIVESQRGRLEFRRGQGGDGHGRDRFGTEWSWRGSLATLGLEIDGGELDSQDYPNPFERIAGALDVPHAGEVWVTAQPGYEFEVTGSKAHRGGASHGSLHALDSLCPVLVGGAAAPALPRHMRSVDIAPLCLELLGLPTPYRVGEPRSAVTRP